MTAILTDALELLANQGELFIGAGMVFLDPGFATELLRPLVDHQLTGAAAAKVISPLSHPPCVHDSDLPLCLHRQGDLPTISPHPPVCLHLTSPMHCVPRRQGRCLQVRERDARPRD